MTKKKEIIESVKELIRKHPDMRFSLRQIYYRLVSTQLLSNTLSEYKYLSRVLVEARKKNMIQREIFEDRTRTFYTNQYRIKKPADVFRSLLLDIELAADMYRLPRWLKQKTIPIIMLEKQALEGFFLPVCRSLEIYLIVNRGYNSFTQLNEFANALRNEKRELMLYVFSDYDPTGLDIQRNFIEQMEELGIEFSSIERVALTQEQIYKYNLPYAPVKKSDARAKDWKGGVVELDALDPDLLIDLIKESANEYFDNSIYQKTLK